MAAPSSELRAQSRCRAFVGGLGLPGLRDLDFGRHFIGYVQHLDWPEDVVVEDLPCAAPLALHRLQELAPAKVVLVTSAARASDPPGAIRRYKPGLASGADVHRHLTASLGGTASVDQTLSVIHHWGALPVDTVVLEVEPADTSVGLGFSEEIGATLDTVLALVREELGTDGSWPGVLVVEDGDVAVSLPEAATPGQPAEEAGNAQPSEDLLELAGYGRFHQRVSRTVDTFARSLRLDDAPRADGVAIASRLRPWGGGLRLGGDWRDVIPLPDGWTGVAMGDVVGRGVEAAPAMCQLRAATWAYALLDGASPGRVLAHLDRLVHAMDVGEMTTLVYLALHARTGQLRLANAGHCPPLLVSPGGGAEFLEVGRSVPLGTLGRTERSDVDLSLPPGSTLVVFTDGLVEGRWQPLPEGLAQLRRAAANGPKDLEALCDHIMTTCLALPQGDDASLLAMRRPSLRRSGDGRIPDAPRTV